MEGVSALCSYCERELQIHLAGNACSLWAKAIWEQWHQTTYLIYCHLISSFIQGNMIERDQISRQPLYPLLNECEVKDQLFLVSNIVEVKQISYLAWIITQILIQSSVSNYLKYLNSSGGFKSSVPSYGKLRKRNTVKKPGGSRLFERAVQSSPTYVRNKIMYYFSWIMRNQ